MKEEMRDWLSVAGLDQMNEEEEAIETLRFLNEGFNKEQEVADIIGPAVISYVQKIVKKSGVSGVNIDVLMRMLAKKLL